MELKIVVIDDSEINLKLFRTLISRIDKVEVLCFISAKQALEWCSGGKADIVLVDYMMPGMDGIEFIKRFRELSGMALVPVVMATANEMREVRYQALQQGATDFLTKPIDTHEFIARIRNLCEMRKGQRFMADQASWLAEEVNKATAEIHDRELETIVLLSRAAEYRDRETGAHIIRMAKYSHLIAKKMGLPTEEQALVLEAAPMHDVGKVGTPDEVLLKPGKLTSEEMEIMKQHSQTGYLILSGSKSPVLQAAATIALSHHEKFDGTGYPKGLSGQDIPLYGRIVAVADVFDALTSKRPYKAAWEIDRAAQHMRESSGKHFDPACVEAFFAAWEEVMDVYHRYYDQ